jgi:DNA polymerase III delta subunit
MLYFFYGNDFKRARENLHEVVSTLEKKKPDASLFKVDSESFSPANFEELISSQGLFEKKYIVVCDKIFENESALEYFTDNISKISESENVFLCIEEKVDAKTKKIIEKSATKVVAFEKAETQAVREFNIFSLSDALAAKDTKKLFSLFHQALFAGISVEEIHPILLFQVRSMLAAANSKDVTSSGLKPFVYQKAKSALKNYSVPELRALHLSLVTMYHDARRGIVDFQNALEKLVLSL